MIVIKDIYYKDSQYCKLNQSKVNLISGFGIDGDIHGGKPGRHVSIMFESTRLKVNSNPLKGLCTSRFKENLTLSGFTELECGNIIRIKDCEIRITQKGKRCFSDCELYKNKISCHLNEVVFGEVLVSGEIKIGDEVFVENN